MKMKPADLFREIVYPLTNVATLVPMIVSWLLFSVAGFFGLFGLFVFIVTLVPFMGYLMKLLEARAHNKEAPAFDAELMALFGNGWALFPLVIVVLLGWVQFAVAQRFSPTAAFVVVFLSGILLPASLGVLSVTRAPLQGLNPFALAQFIKSTATDYLLLIVTLDAVALILYLLLLSGVSSFWLGFGLVYLAFLLYSMTGAVTGSHRLTEKIHIAAPLGASTVQSQRELIGARQGVLNHAYGFVSRGNRAGGLAHIQTRIDSEADQDEANHWFFNEMLKWEDPGAALFFAQSYLHLLLSQQREPAALKLLSQCFFANSQFRPAEEDRAEVVELAARHGRNDLLKFLR
jgi:hypothetical protein